MKRFLLFVASILASCTVANAQEQRDIDEFQAYWNKFRDAVIARDSVAIAQMTLFPFTRKADDAMVTCVTSAEFLPIANRIFDDFIFDREFSGTYRDHLAHHPVITQSDFLGGQLDRIRIGDLKFKKVDGKWFFYLAYANF
jgi:hypothetical protein